MSLSNFDLASSGNGRSPPSSSKVALIFSLWRRDALCGTFVLHRGISNLNFNPFTPTNVFLATTLTAQTSWISRILWEGNYGYLTKTKDYKKKSNLRFNNAEKSYSTKRYLTSQYKLNIHSVIFSIFQKFWLVYMPLLAEWHLTEHLQVMSKCRLGSERDKTQTIIIPWNITPFGLQSALY